MLENFIEKRRPVGDLSEIIIQFIRFKRSLGFNFKDAEGVLYRFSIFSCDFEIIDKKIPQTLIDNWCTRNVYEKNSTFRSRVNILTQFLNYSKNYGYTFILPEIPKYKVEKYHPYIFTEREIKSIFKVTDNMTVYPGSWRHIVSPILYRLMYSCGLRVSETVSLKCNQIDWVNDVIIVDDTKNKKERLIPFSSSLKLILKNYYYLYRKDDLENPYLFPGKYSQHMDRHLAYKWFRKILTDAEITHLGKGIGPRIHDLRHTFCVHSLKQMKEQGVDLYVGLPILSKYVGHVSINETQHYLRLTAELFPEIEKTIRDIAGKIIPSTEVAYYETY